MKEKIFALVLVIFGLACSFIIAEVGLRVLGTTFQPMVLDVFQKDSFGNLRVLPNIKRHHLTDEWDVEVATNQGGWRDSPDAIKDSSYKIISIGDSFTFGWGVKYRESFTYLLRKELTKNANIQVFNLGVPGTGTGDHAKLLQTVGREFKPDIVLYNLFVGNDFFDVLEGGTDRYAIRDGFMITKSRTDRSDGIMKRIEFLVKRYSVLAQLVVPRYWILRDKIIHSWLGRPITHPGLQNQDDEIRKMFQIHLNIISDKFQKTISKTLDYLDDMLMFCEANNSKLIIQVIPRSLQIYQNTYNEFVESFNLTPEDIDLDKAQRILFDWAKKNKSPAMTLVDPLPNMRKTNKEGAPRMYFNPNNHWNSKGHLYSAEMLLPVIKQYIEKSEKIRRTR